MFVTSGRFLALLLFVTLAFARRMEWNDEDTIIVEATKEEDIENVLVERQDLPVVPYKYHYYPSHATKSKSRGSRRQGRAFVHTCYSVLGDQGRCTTFQECFPMLYYTEGEHKGHIKHPVLADLLLSTSGPCTPPPLSFRDDFVPYEASQEEKLAPPETTFNIDRKDLICCPSTKSTPIPPSAEWNKPLKPSQFASVPEKVKMRTSTSTQRPSTDSPDIYPSLPPDVVASFIGNPNQKVVGSADAAPSFKPIGIKTPTTLKPKPAVGQWGHRITTRPTTTAQTTTTRTTTVRTTTKPALDEDESEEEVRKPVKPTVSPKRPVFSGGDVGIPTGNRKPVPAGSPTISSAVAYPNIGSAAASSIPPLVFRPTPADASVPLTFPPSTPKPLTSKTRRPFIPYPSPTADDVFVPVIPVGSLVPEDSVMIMTKPRTTISPPTVVPTTILAEVQSKPNTPLPDAAVGNFGAIVETRPAVPSPQRPKPTSYYVSPTPGVTVVSNIAADVAVRDTPSPFVVSKETSTAYPGVKEIPARLNLTINNVVIQRPKLPAFLDRAPCGRLNSSSDPKYPWVAAIQLGSKFICAGSVIDDYHIMTAASCIAHLSTTDLGRLRIYLGERILNSNQDGPTIMRKILRSMRHRGFSITTLRNDIALLRLSLPIPVGTNRVRPICLPLDEDRKLILETFADTSIIGWGEDWNKVYNDVTHESKLRVWTKDACVDQYRQLQPDTTLDDDDFLCAQYVQDESFSPGLVGTGKTLPTQEVETSGSPMILKDKHNIYQQIGISSWKIGSSNSFPRILTRVSSYRDWIEKNRHRP